MITSAKQLKVTKERIASFDEAIRTHSSPPDGVHLKAHEAALRSLKGLRAQLLTQVEQYERLIADGISAIRVEQLSDLPAALIQARIAGRLSQAALAELMEVAPQQVQRWEREEYENAGFAVVLDAADALGLAERIRLVQPENRTEFAKLMDDAATQKARPSVEIDERPSGLRITWESKGASKEVQITPDKVRLIGKGDPEVQYVRSVSKWRTAPSESRSFAEEHGNA